MCGFAGYLGHGPWEGASPATETLRKMAQAIASRGPDDSGEWADQNAGIGLSHRRLSIVDLSPAGHQPMSSPSGRFVIAYNGEIYNHLDLRKQIAVQGKTPNWRGHSDTETLLSAIEAWGFEETLKRSVGMFAIALWDREQRTLTLARDRAGEKPLYYGWQGQGEAAVLLFGSELKALRAHPAFSAGIRRDALTLFLRHNYIPAPHTVYNGIYKLPPATRLTVSLGEKQATPQIYWSLTDVATEGVEKPLQCSPAEAVNELEHLLKSAISQQMVADVPLGAFLSGGIDSSTVVALMQAQANRPVRTFTIGFNEKGYNEAVHAKAVAQHLGTDHTELYVTPQQAMDVIPRLPTMYDEPFADSSQIPTFLVSQLARQHVTVSLSGDAGDELFSGYTRYQVASKRWVKLCAIPLPARRLVAIGLTSLRPQTWNRLTEWLPRSESGEHWGEKLHKAARMLHGRNIDGLYHGLVSQWSDPSAVVQGGNEPATLLTEQAPVLLGLSHIERMMALDLITYLPDDILVKVDRAAMNVGLETRVPLLDHRVIAFAWRLPMHMKQREGVGKWALREVLYRHVPKSLIDRPKMGFGIPINNWLRGPLREWAEELLDARRLRSEGFFEPEAIQTKWQEHLSGQYDWAYQLWIILMFQAWLERQAK